MLYFNIFRYVYLCTILCVSTVSDIKFRRIPNGITFPSILIGLLTSCIATDAHSLLRSIVMIVILYAFGMLNLCGMGDLKLLMVLSTFFDISSFLLAVGVGTGAMIVYWLITQFDTAKQEIQNAVSAILSQNLKMLDQKGTKLPYAPFILIGSLVTMGVHIFGGVLS